MSLLIKNIQIIDGTNRPAIKADILIKKDRIIAIGNLSKYETDEVIDGRNAYATPGFIDINNCSDRYGSIFEEPLQAHFLQQGVTTIIGGQCGISLAPLLYGTLEVTNPWMREGRINVNWQTMREYLRTLEKTPRGINVGTLVGHTTVKHELTKNISRDFSEKERRIALGILEHALEEGALGCSIEFPAAFPPRTMTNHEFEEIGKLVAKYKGVITLHIDTAGDILKPFIAKAIGLSKQTGVKIIISHFTPMRGSEEEYDDALTKIHKESAGADVYFDYASSPAREIPLITILAPWRGGTHDYALITRALYDEKERKKIMEQLPTIAPEKIRITRAPNWEHIEGMTLGQFADNRGMKNFHEAIIALIMGTSGRVIVAYPQMHPPLHTILFHDRSVIASHDTDHGGQYSTPHRTFTDIIRRNHKKKIIPVHTLVYKMTGLPAKIIGIAERGIIQNGNIADIVLMRDGEVEEVIVSGTRMMQEHAVREHYPGVVIKQS